MINKEQAIRILDPATTREALVEIECHAGFNGQRAVIEAVNEACMMGAEALRNERPKGRWVGEVIHTEIGEEHAMQECSHCGKIRIIDNFCPNCGADMRDGEEE